MASRRGLVDPGSPSAEAFGRCVLHSSSVSADRQPAVVITSAEPGAGKSTIAANFALVSALTHARVLLIDADLRRPVQHEIFGVSRARPRGAARARRTAESVRQYREDSWNMGSVSRLEELCLRQAY